MKPKKFDLALDCFQQIDELAGSVRLLQQVNGEGRDEAALRLKTYETMQKDFKALRRQIFRLL